MSAIHLATRCVHPRLIVQKRMPTMDGIHGGATLQAATERAVEIRALEREWRALDARIAYGHANPRAMPLDSYEIALVEREALERRLEALRAEPISPRDVGHGAGLESDSSGYPLGSPRLRAPQIVSHAGEEIDEAVRS